MPTILMYKSTITFLPPPHTAVFYSFSCHQQFIKLIGTESRKIVT